VTDTPDFQYTIRAPQVRDAYDQEHRDRELEDYINSYLRNAVGLSTAYFPFDQPGVVVTDTSTYLYVPFDCTLTNTWCTLVTASSSGSVTFRLTDGTTNWDHTFTSGSTTPQTLTPNASLSAGALLRATVTAAGTDAEDLALLIALRPV
jgi:hypothetical protein